MKYSWQQQNETLFSNSLQLLFKGDDITVNSIGLKELVKLKQERRIDPERIDFITSSGLQIKGAYLQKANLQRAELYKADLQGTDLQETNIQLAVLVNSLYDERTKFLEGFDPKQHGMIEVKST